MKIHATIINDFGGAPFAEHDMACPVCSVNHAVLELDTGRFNPCWECQKEGWIMHRLPKWVVRIMKRMA